MFGFQLVGYLRRRGLGGGGGVSLGGGFDVPKADTWAQSLSLSPAFEPQCKALDYSSSAMLAGSQLPPVMVLD